MRDHCLQGFVLLCLCPRIRWECGQARGFPCMAVYVHKETIQPCLRIDIHYWYARHSLCTFLSTSLFSVSIYISILFLCACIFVCLCLWALFLCLYICICVFFYMCMIYICIIIGVCKNERLWSCLSFVCTWCVCVTRRIHGVEHWYVAEICINYTSIFLLGANATKGTDIDMCIY